MLIADNAVPRAVNHGFVAQIHAVEGDILRETVSKRRFGLGLMLEKAGDNASEENYYRKCGEGKSYSCPPRFHQLSSFLSYASSIEMGRMGVTVEIACL